MLWQIWTSFASFVNSQSTRVEMNFVNSQSMRVEMNFVNSQSTGVEMNFVNSQSTGVEMCVTRAVVHSRTVQVTHPEGYLNI